MRTGSVCYKNLGFLAQQVGEMFIFAVPDCPVKQGQVYLLVRHGIYIFVFCIKGDGPKHQVCRCNYIE